MNDLLPSSRAGLRARGVLLSCAALTVMTGPTLAPALPAIGREFMRARGAEALLPLVVTLPAFVIAITASGVGRLADRLGRRRVLVASLALYAAAGGSGLVASDVVTLLLGRALLGVAAAGAMTSSTAIAASLLDSDERARFFGRQASLMSLAGVASVALGGLLATVAWRAPFALYLIALPISLLTLRFVVEPARGEGEHTQDAIDSHAPRQRLPIYALTFVAMAFVFMVPLQVPFLLAAQGPLASGLAVALSSLVAAFSSLILTRTRVILAPGPRWLARSFFVMGAGYLIVGSFAGANASLVGLALAGLGSGWIMPLVSRWLVASTSERTRSASIGALTSSVYAGQFASPFVSSLLGASQSASHAFAHAGCALLILSVALLWRRAP